MLTKLQKWGNSQGIRIPKKILEDFQISEGDNLDISVIDNKIIIKHTHKLPNKYSLNKLLSNYKATDEQELEWGNPVGKEEW